MLDFDPEANCPEPWNINPNDIGVVMYDTRGSTTIELIVHDYDLDTTHHAPEVECPEIWNGANIVHNEQLGCRIQRMDGRGKQHEAGAVRLFAGGLFDGTTDFNPGPGTETWISAAQMDGFIVNYQSNGDYDWSRAFGSTDSDGVSGVAA